mgnify:FL=1
MKISLNKELCGSILDIGGGGEGIIGRLYKSAVTAVDNMQEELDEAPSCCKKLLMDAAALDFADESFDNVTFFYSLMYMNTDVKAKAIEEACRVLKTGGALTIWDVEFESAYPDAFSVELDIILPEENVCTEYGIIGTDVAQSAESIISMCCECGLNPLEHEENGGHFHIVLEK